MTRRTPNPSTAETLPGLHRVTWRGKSGVAEYWYAWRGGPRIAVVKAPTDAALRAAIAAALPAAIAAYEAERAPAANARTADSRFLYGLVTRYLDHLNDPANTALAPRTKSDRRKHLDVVRRDLGELETQALQAKGARLFLIQWRDRYKATPKTADERLGALSAVLQWAADRGELSGNPVAEFPRLYKVDRADIIWEPQHLAALLAHAAPEFAFAVRLAALTGLREGDLVKIPRSAIREDAIVWQTGKSRGRRTIVLPITPPLRRLLAEIAAHPRPAGPRGRAQLDAVTILTSSRGRPWKASGLAAALRRGREDALAHAVKIHGPNAGPDGGPTLSGIEGLRWHDLRGTAATNYAAAGMDVADIALTLGWKPERVREIIVRYVTAEALGLAMVRRLGKNAPKTPAVKTPVKTAQTGPRKRGNS